MADSFETGANDAITDVPGIRVGHWSDRRAGTGCTVVLCESAAVAAADVRGGAPGTRETDVLAGPNLVRTCHAVLFSGGSVFGLEAAGGVVRYLAEHDVGFPTKVRPVPIVPAAVLYDLGVGRPDVAPGADAGYRAAKRAKGGRVEQGSVGAGTGATAAKILGPEHAIKGGIGTASIRGPRGLVVGAIVVTNPVGAVVSPDDGATIAGARGAEGAYVPLAEALERHTAEMDAQIENTTLVCVATNATIEHSLAQRLAFQAHNGLARTILPVHTFGDGDAAFVLGMSRAETKPHDSLALGAMTTLAVERAVVKSIHAATGLHGVPSAAEWTNPSTGSDRSS